MTMREIKFRGRDEHGEWHYGAFMGVFYDGVVAPIEYANIYDDGMATRVLPNTVGQFTGIKDITGADIYEGDIVQLDGWDKPTVVMWDDRSGMYIVDRDLIFSHVHKFSKVIGNVHDNPELLERNP